LRRHSGEKVHNATTGAKVKNFVAGIVATLIVFTFGGWLYLRLGLCGPASESSTFLARI